MYETLITNTVLFLALALAGATVEDHPDCLGTITLLNGTELCFVKPEPLPFDQIFTVQSLENGTIAIGINESLELVETDKYQNEGFVYYEIIEKKETTESYIIDFTENFEINFTGNLSSGYIERNLILEPPDTKNSSCWGYGCGEEHQYIDQFKEDWLENKIREIVKEELNAEPICDDIVTIEYAGGTCIYQNCSDGSSGKFCIG